MSDAVRNFVLRTEIHEIQGRCSLLTTAMIATAVTGTKSPCLGLWACMACFSDLLDATVTGRGGKSFKSFRDLAKVAGYSGPPGTGLGIVNPIECDDDFECDQHRDAITKKNGDAGKRAVRRRIDAKSIGEVGARERADIYAPPTRPADRLSSGGLARIPGGRRKRRIRLGPGLLVPKSTRQLRRSIRRIGR